MKVRFSYPMGSEGWTDDIEVEAVPRVGDQVSFDDGETEYTVRDRRMDAWVRSRGLRGRQTMSGQGGSSADS